MGASQATPRRFLRSSSDLKQLLRYELFDIEQWKGGIPPRRTDIITALHFDSIL